MAWMLDHLPAEWRQYRVLIRHPVALAWMTIRHLRGQPALSVRIETTDAVGQLTLWESGEADVVWARAAAPEAPSQERSSLRSRTGFRGCLYDLEARLGINDRSA